MAESSDPRKSEKKEQVALFVLFQHGLGGFSRDLGAVRSGVEEVLKRDPARNVAHYQLWSCEDSQFLYSHPGTKSVVDRLMPKLRTALKEFVKKAPLVDDEGAASTDDSNGSSVATAVHKRLFSCVGHSFGGVIIREVIHRLHQDAELSSAFEFDTFLSVASPHTGVQTSNAQTRYGGALVAALFSSSVEDLILGNDYLSKELVSAPYLAAWKRFNRRVLVGCLNGDRRVEFTTACLCYDDEHILALNKEGKELPKGKNVLRHYSVDGEHPESPHASSVKGMAEGKKRLRERDPKGAAISDTLLNEMPFIVVPVRSDAYLPTAHSAVLANAWFSNQMNDSVEAAVQYLVPN